MNLDDFSGQFNAKKGMTPDFIEQALIGLQPQHEKMLSEYPAGFDSLQVEKQLAYLNSENKQIRSELRRLNDYITAVIEYRRLCNQFYFT